MTDEELQARLDEHSAVVTDVSNHAAKEAYDTIIRIIDPVLPGLRPVVLGAALGIVRARMESIFENAPPGPLTDMMMQTHKLVYEALQTVRWEATEQGRDAGFDPAAHLGDIPHFLRRTDDRSAKEQIAERYISGWNPICGCSIDMDTKVLTFPGDPPYQPMATAKLRDELVVFYLPSELVAVIDPDGSYEVSRVD